MLADIDHIVLTIDNIDKSIFFYRNVLGMTLKEIRPVGKESKFHKFLNIGNYPI